MAQILRVYFRKIMCNNNHLNTDILLFHHKLISRGVLSCMKLVNDNGSLTLDFICNTISLEAPCCAYVLQSEP